MANNENNNSSSNNNNKNKNKNKNGSNHRNDSKTCKAKPVLTGRYFVRQLNA
jgi:hypothetical protein